MHRHFVYYRVHAANVDAARAAARALHARHGSVELLRRVEADADADADADGAPVTLMEIYAVPDRAQAECLERDARLALAPWLVGVRHVEVFETLD